MKFEDNLKKLDELVRRMESGDMKLDDMIKAFEDGRKLVETCQKNLDELHLKIEKVTADGVSPVGITVNDSGERDIAI